MNDADQEQELLDQLAEEFASRCRRGERPALHEYEQRFPALADRLREVLPSVALLEEFKRDRNRPGKDLSASDNPEQLGDYRLVREIGRGGMGIVYEAVQQSLGRRVALKILPQHALADPRRLDRFRREAQAAARLHHTNIVPVFGLFEAEGWHFYVMQFIDGRGLDVILTDVKRGDVPRDTKPTSPSTVPTGPAGPALDPTAALSDVYLVPTDETPHHLAKSRDVAYFRHVANLAAQAAGALGYAHDQGVLHRDIKPANLLVDERGTLWITDFGLARLTENDGLTNPGDVLGTLQYLAPERFHGENDARSDVYSLGLTLYELLALRSPFVERQPGRLMREICEGRPQRPRELRPDIPADLETITLKAIARDPAQRYPSAHAFASDLQRFLADQPIQARRATPAERLWRWSRRNRAFAGLGGVALTSLVIAAVVGWLAYVSTTRALQGEATKRGEAEAATERAEANMQLSLDALEEIFLALAPPQRDRAEAGFDGRGPFRPPRGLDDPGRPPGDPAKEAQLLKTVLQFYERFAATNATNSRLKREAARSHRRVADIHERENELEAADGSYQHACTLFAELAAADSDDDGTVLELVETQLRHADLLALLGLSERQETLLAETANKAKSLIEQSPDDGRYQALVARVDRSRARLLHRQQRTSEAVKVLEQSIAELEQAPPSRGIHDALIEQHDLLADLLGLEPSPRPLPPRRRGEGPPPPPPPRP